MASVTPWQLEQGHGHLQTSDGAAVVHIDRLADGLTQIIRSGSTISALRLLGVLLPGFPDPLPVSSIVDRYVRGDDLIVTYERQSPEHLRAQVYWRYVSNESSSIALTNGRAEGVHLIVSIQTDRLDLQPTLTVVSSVPTEQILFRASARRDRFRTIADQGDGELDLGSLCRSPMLLARLTDVDLSLVLMTLPSDLVRLRVERQGPHCRCAFELLDEHLEKGVIRRAQVAAWFVPRTTDQFWALKLFRLLLAAPPPLTT
jgi:hypothetical protein